MMYTLFFADRDYNFQNYQYPVIVWAVLQNGAIPVCGAHAISTREPVPQILGGWV